MIDLQGWTRGRGKAFPVGAGPFGELFFAGWVPEVCGRTAHITDDPLEAGILHKTFRLAKDGFRASAGDSAALMECDRTEIAASKAAAVMHDRKFYLLNRGDTALCFIAGVVHPLERQRKHRIQFLGGERERRFGLDEIEVVPMFLDDLAAAHRILFGDLGISCFGVGELVLPNLCVGGDGNRVGWKPQLVGQVADPPASDTACRHALCARYVQSDAPPSQR